MSEFRRNACYAERSIRPAGLIVRDGWRLKRYDTTIDGGPVPDSCEEGERLALALLPTPAQSVDRPGVGFVIRHAGRDAAYLVVCWWDNQNELLQRVLIRFNEPEGAWRDAAGRYSVCVWDLAVIHHERDAYVAHVMTPPSGPDLDAYAGAWYRSGPGPV